MAELTVSPRLQASASKEPPFFSLLVPAYNVASTLDKALRSAEKTRRAPLEILVIDDGSNDATAEIAAAHSKHDSRVRVLTKANGGYGQAMNFGLSQAAGDYILILEPDDYLAPGALDELFAFILDQKKMGKPSADIVKATYWRILKDGEDMHEARFLCSYAHLARTGETLGRKQIASLLASHPSIWNAAYHRAFLNERNIRFVEAPGAAWVDGPFATETLLAAKKVLFFDKPLYCYFEDNPAASSAKDVSAFAPQRFAEMMARKERLAPHDVDAARALTVVGLNYVERIIKTDAIARPEVAAKVQGIVELLDENDIMAVPQISPQVKRAAFHLKGRSVPRISSLPYSCYLLRRAIKEMRNNGLRFVWSQLQTVRKRSAVTQQSVVENDARQSNANQKNAVQNRAVQKETVQNNFVQKERGGRA